MLYINDEFCKNLDQLKGYFNNCLSDNDIYTDLLESARNGSLSQFLRDLGEAELADNVDAIDQKLSDSKYMRRISQIIVNNVIYVNKRPYNLCFDIDKILCSHDHKDIIIAVELSILDFVNEDYVICIDSNYGKKELHINTYDLANNSHKTEEIRFPKDNKDLDFIGKINVDRKPIRSITHSLKGATHPAKNTKSISSNIPMIGDNESQSAKDELLIYNWLEDEYKKLDVRGFVSEETRSTLRRAAHDALYRITNVKREIEIPITYVRKYKGSYPKLVKQTTMLLSPAKLGQLRRQAMIEQGLSTPILQCGMIIHKSQGEYGFIDIFNQIVIPHIYEEIKELPSGFIRVKRCGKYGLRSSDSGCRVVIDCKYDKIIDYKRYEIKGNADQSIFAWGRIGTNWQLLDENGCVRDPKSRGIYLTP